MRLYIHRKGVTPSPVAVMRDGKSVRYWSFRNVKWEVWHFLQFKSISSECTPSCRLEHALRGAPPYEGP